MSFKTSLASNLHALGYTLETYDKSPGLYFESLDQATLYTTEWKTIVYVPVRPTANQTAAIDQYVNHISKLCSGVDIRNWTDCSHFHEIVLNKLRQVKSTEQLLLDVIEPGNDRRRIKRGVFNFVGTISKILFGTMDEDNALYYNEQIKHFEQNSDGLTDLLKQQLYVVQSSLGAINETLTDMEYNEGKVREGLAQLQHYVDSLASESEKFTNLVSIKITVETHIAQVTDALNLIQ